MKGWWRRQWPWLMGTVVLGTCAVAGPYLQAKRDSFVIDEADEIQMVAAAKWGHYRGARFHLVAIKPVPANLLPREQRLLPGSQVLVMGLDIVPDLTKAGETSVRMCRLALRDGRGRSWVAAPDELAVTNKLMGADGDCSRSQSEARVGPYQIKRLFLVPADVAVADLRLEVSLLQGAAKGELPLRRLSMRAPAGR